MNILKGYEEQLSGIFSDWIKVQDFKNPLTLDNFSKNGVPAEMVKPHCAVCTTVNQCWFKNEENKKPKEMDYDSYSKFNRKQKGLYHPYCHCQKRGLNPPKEEDIKIVLDKNKENYFFNSKGNWFYSWGYKDKDKNDFIKTLKEKIIKAYVRGNYINGKYDFEEQKKYGFRINIFVTIDGVNENKGHFYDMKSGFIVYPNGRLKNTTPLIRREK